MLALSFSRPREIDHPTAVSNFEKSFLLLLLRDPDRRSPFTCSNSLPVRPTPLFFSPRSPPPLEGSALPTLVDRHSIDRLSRSTVAITDIDTKLYLTCAGKEAHQSERPSVLDP